MFSGITWPISTKLGIKHPWVKDIQVCLNEGPRSFLLGNNIRNSGNSLTQFLKVLLQNH